MLLGKLDIVAGTIHPDIEISEEKKKMNAETKSRTNNRLVGKAKWNKTDLYLLRCPVNCD